MPRCYWSRICAFFVPASLSIALILRDLRCNEKKEKALLCLFYSNHLHRNSILHDDATTSYTVR